MEIHNQNQLKHQEGTNNHLKFYICDKCDYKTQSKYFHKYHMIRHDDTVQPIKCPKCLYETKYKTSMATHMRCHNTSKEIFKCDSCSYTTTQNKYLGNHLSTLHTQQKNVIATKNYSDTANLTKCCSKCEFQTSDMMLLKDHVRGHDNSIQKLKCDKCDYLTTFKKNFRNHMFIHVDNAFKCAKCTCWFKRSYHFSRHMKLFHET